MILITICLSSFKNKNKNTYRQTIKPKKRRKKTKKVGPNGEGDSVVGTPDNKQQGRPVAIGGEEEKWDCEARVSIWIQKEKKIKNERE